MNTEHLRFPIGPFIAPEEITKQDLHGWIYDFELFPTRLEELIENMAIEELNWKYRPGGWSVKQVIHHCADSHMNSMMRFKLALTEDNPVIRPYYEDRWAELVDSRSDDVRASVLILKGIHHKLSTLFKMLTDDELKRTFVHPEHNKTFTVAYNIGNYAWHSNHHLAHIKLAIEAAGIYN